MFIPDTSFKKFTAWPLSILSLLYVFCADAGLTGGGANERARNQFL